MEVKSKVVRNPGDIPIPGYRLMKPLGAGGFGEVWMCEAPGEIHKAIKFVRGKLNSKDDEDIFAEQEYRALQIVKDVRYPFVLTTERIDVQEGEIVIVMELADRSLQDVMVEVQLAGQIGIPREKLINYLADAADGLDHMNDKCKLQHLDVKPRNLFLIGDRIKVADFGLVKSLDRRLNAGLLGGASPLYAAPETFGGKLSRYTDQYSLGIVYMELLTGKFPFHGRSLRQLAVQHLNNEPDLRPMPERDRAAVARALAKDPAKRFPSSSAFIKALRDSPSARVDLFSPKSEPIDIGHDEDSSEWDDSIPMALPVTESILNSTKEVDLASLASLDATGKLRPLILLGIGGFGRRALREVKRRLSDRLGDLTNVPVVRFLYLDADPELRERAVTGLPDSSLDDQAVFPIPLQPPGKYRGRNRDHLMMWLPSDKINALGRSLQLNGSRALGRLSLYDNYLRITTRLRREIELAMHPESVSSTARVAGWEVDLTPRIVVFASAIGGSSGMLPDLGFALRRLLMQMNYGSAPLESFLFCGSPDDPATPLRDLANLHATLTEINHFHDPAIPFHAEYTGSDGPKLDEKDEAWTGCYLLRTASRTPEALEELASSLAGYVTQLAFSSLREDHDRHELDKSAKPTVFRSFGICGAWFPRGLILRAAAREATRRLLENWQAPPGSAIDDAVKQKLEIVRASQPHAPQRLRALFEEKMADAGMNSTSGLAKQFEAWNKQLVEGFANQNPTDLASLAIEEVTRELGTVLGSPATAPQNRGKLHATFNEVAYEVAGQLTDTIFAQLESLSMLPGSKLGRIEQAVAQLGATLANAATGYSPTVLEKRSRVEKRREEVQAAYQSCAVGGFSLFGMRASRSVRQLLDVLSNYAHERYEETADETAVRCMRTIQSNLEERCRDLLRCRQKLGHLREGIQALPRETNYQQPVKPDKRDPGDHANLNLILAPVDSNASVGILLPKGNSDIPSAACDLVDRLRDRDWARLEEVLQTLVVQPSGGLIPICLLSSDLQRDLAQPLIEQGAAFLGSLVKFQGVFDLLNGFQNSQQSQEVFEQLLHPAEPSLGGADSKEKIYLIVPHKPDLQTTTLRAKSRINDIEWINLPESSSEWLLIRERNNLRVEDLQELLTMCKDAYSQLSGHIATSPHARFDIQEWLPLE